MPVRSFSVLFVALCAALLCGPGTAEAQGKPVSDHAIAQFGQPPSVPDGPLSPALATAVQTALIDSMVNSEWGPDQIAGLAQVRASGDARLVWIISDMLRFILSPDLNDELSIAAADLLGIQAPRQNQWGVITDHLIAWDIPAPPNYLSAKREIFTSIVPGWEKIFAPGKIDWRLVSWGGVLIDDRRYNAGVRPCNCIPAADNPSTTSAEEATWLKDDAIVFGVEVNGEYRAYPRQIMEVREMVNDTLGGRKLGIPYCTLCGAAQAYYTDKLPLGIRRPILRTSGLLSRSNKVMYDLRTHSVFDTFTGEAVTGPLAKRGLQLKQASVVTTDWGTWKAAHPDTTVLAEEHALGRNPDFRNTRDANGPIFPVGDVDPRLPVHEDVIGVVTEQGQALAFQRSKALLALKQGRAVKVGQVQLVLVAGGVKVVDANGADLGSHQAFWFAWSQFHPDTQLWTG